MYDLPRSRAHAPSFSISQLRAVLPNTTAGNLTAGASARTSVGLLLMPMTVVKTRMESSIYHNSNIAVALRDIWRTQGVRGLFAGFWPTTLRDAPTAGLFLVVYERIRSLAVPFDFPKASVDASAGEWLLVCIPGPRPPLTRFHLALHAVTCAGALAAGFSTVATAPFDTVKTRRQLKPQVYTGVIQAFRLISVTEGPAGFFRGVTLRCLRKAASSGIAWSLVSVQEKHPRSKDGVDAIGGTLSDQCLVLCRRE